MIRQQVEEYLDEGLTPAERTALEMRIDSDASVARVLTSVKAERALRAKAFAEYAPSSMESGALAARVLAACAEDAAAPVGRIGLWVRRGLATAAGLAIVATAFAVGRMSAPRAAVPVAAAPADVIRVLYADEGGEPQMKEFASLDDANSFCRDMATKHAEPVVVASGFDEEHPGSF